MISLCGINLKLRKEAHFMLNMASVLAHIQVAWVRLYVAG
jgi:hypothetical protein